MKNLNKLCEKLVHERFNENLASGKAVREYMESSTAVYHGVPVACLYMPKIFSAAAWDCLNSAAHTMYTILEKVIRRYLDDPAYRTLFPFSAELDELIRTEAGYPCLLPIARLDIFFNEDDFSFKFCEFNADGASGMNESRELDNAHRQSDIFLQMNSTHKIRPFELFDTWIQDFAGLYDSYSGNGNESTVRPRIVITDFTDRATPNEFIAFRTAFQKAGFDTDICDIRELMYTGGELKTPDGRKVDAVYRRAVTCDIMERKNEAAAFIEAAKDGAVCIIGHFRTQIIHNKAIFRILRMPETSAFLTEAEVEFIAQHIPETLRLKTGEFDPAEILANKDEWIIKPEDLYGSRGVYAGIDHSPEKWRNHITQATDADYLLQRYCPPFRSVNLNFNGNDSPNFEEYNNITGMFMYGGKLAGLYSRAGQSGVISSHEQGMTMASFVETKE